jgi:hypothetical protein
MKRESEITNPIRFNALKHHRNFILQALQENASEKIIELLEPICNNYIDIYTGAYTPDEIGTQVTVLLESIIKLSKSDFCNWVGETKGYRQIELTDGSHWIVRESMEKGQYIHLHPARTGKHCYRFKGSTLKTALMIKTMNPSGKQILSLEMVNQVRVQIGLSPVKNWKEGRGF